MQVYIPLTAGGGMVEAVSEARIFAAKSCDDVFGDGKRERIPKGKM